jgi:hypothetical protein
LNGKIPSKITLKVLDYFKTKDPDKFYVNLVCIQLCMLSSKLNFLIEVCILFIVYEVEFVYKVKRKL